MIYSQYLNDKTTPKEGYWFPIERVGKVEYKNLLNKGQVFRSKAFKSIGCFVSNVNYSNLPLAVIIAQSFKEDGIYTISQNDKAYALVKNNGNIHPCSDKYYHKSEVERLSDIFFNLPVIDISEKELDYEKVTNGGRAPRLLEVLRSLVKVKEITVKN